MKGLVVCSILYFIAGEGFNTNDGQNVSSATGHGYHITVDGNSVNFPDITHIYFQIYDA